MSRYVMNEDDLWGLVSALGVKTKVHADEVQFEYCPYCHGGSKRDKWKFGINRKTGEKVVMYTGDKTSCLIELRKRQKPGKKRNDVINNESDKNHYIHTKIKFDNILTKVQVSYVNFLVDFINIVLENFGRKDLKFKYIDSKIKKNNKISQRQKIKGGSIGDILNNKISCKYTTLDKDSNIILLQNLENEGLFEIIEILEQNFLFFFEKVYYKSLRKFNLKEFGLIDLEVVLPKQVKLFENLLMKNKNDLRFDEYKKKLEKCIQRHFLGGLEEELNSSDSSNQSEF